MLVSMNVSDCNKCVLIVMYLLLKTHLYIFTPIIVAIIVHFAEKIEQKMQK